MRVVNRGRVIEVEEEEEGPEKSESPSQRHKPTNEEEEEVDMWSDLEVSEAGDDQISKPLGEKVQDFFSPVLSMFSGATTLRLYPLLITVSGLICAHFSKTLMLQ